MINSNVKLHSPATLHRASSIFLVSFDWHSHFIEKSTISGQENTKIRKHESDKQHFLCHSLIFRLRNRLVSYNPFENIEQSWVQTDFILCFFPYRLWKVLIRMGHKSNADPMRVCRMAAVDILAPLFHWIVIDFTIYQLFNFTFRIPSARRKTLIDLWIYNNGRIRAAVIDSTFGKAADRWVNRLNLVQMMSTSATQTFLFGHLVHRVVFKYKSTNLDPLITATVTIDDADHFIILLACVARLLHHDKAIFTVTTKILLWSKWRRVEFMHKNSIIPLARVDRQRPRRWGEKEERMSFH